MAYTVYLRTNLINGKQYVGQTNNFKIRNYNWNCLSFNYASKVLNQDREKYGLENWTSETLAEVETQEEAWELEEKYIKELNTREPNGYNYVNGGSGSHGRILSEETKYKIAMKLKGKLIKKRWKKVYKYSLDNKLIKVYDRIRDVEKDGYTSSLVSKCCNGKAKTHKGYKWSFEPL